MSTQLLPLFNEAMALLSNGKAKSEQDIVRMLFEAHLKDENTKTHATIAPTAEQAWKTYSTVAPVEPAAVPPVLAAPVQPVVSVNTEAGQVVEPRSADAPMPDFKAIAEKMISMGAYVYPLPAKEKACKDRNWQNLATRDLAVVAKWAESKPHANVAVVGKPDGLWLFDDDKDILAEYESVHGKLNTYRVRSVSGGTHLYFTQNDASRAMGNISGTDEQGKETWSARVNNRYVVSAGSVSYPDNDRNNPLTAYVVIDRAPVIEAPDSFIEFLKTKASKQKLTAPAVAAGVADLKIVEGGRNIYLASRAGKLRQDGLGFTELYPILQRINQEMCEPPLDVNEVESIAKSMCNYAVKDNSLYIGGVPAEVRALELAQQQQARERAADAEPEIEDCDLIARPVFPRWVMRGTSIYEGLVKPAVETSSKYPELIWMPAVQLLLNYIAGRVHLKGRSMMIPNLFLGIISPYGRFFKSSSCHLAQDYFKFAGLAEKHTLGLRSAEAKVIISSVGSSEGFGVAMQNLNAKHALLFFPELSKFISKAGIEHSSFMDDILVFYESEDYGNLIKSKKESFQFGAGTYCFGWLWCTTDRKFPSLWARLSNADSGLNDRMFFLLSPENPQVAGLYKDPNYVDAAALTRGLIEKATDQGIFDYEDYSHVEGIVAGLDPRSIGLVERLALYFAVDMGSEVITTDHAQRARALVDYRNQVQKYLDPIEAETVLGRVQQEMTRELRFNRGKMSYRDFSRNLHADRKGTEQWRIAVRGLVDNGTIAIREGKSGKGTEHKPRMVYLLKQED